MNNIYLSEHDRHKSLIGIVDQSLIVGIVDPDSIGIDDPEEWQASKLSYSVNIGPIDKRCKYWAKVIRVGTTLPLPVNVQCANDLPTSYLKNGSEELFSGDYLIEGEQTHHRKMRGWCYHLTYIDQAGGLQRICPKLEHKTKLKTQKIDPSLLPGSGDLATIVRIIHGLDAGLSITE